MEKKNGTLALLAVLKEYSDEDHILSQKELHDLLNIKYGLDLDRRTIYTNISLLNEFGYEISTFEDNKKGYYLIDREFDPSEIFLLANAIHSSNYIPSKASKELISKLLNTQSKYFKENYNHTVYVENDSKKDNKEFFLNVELLSEAIKNKKVVSFNYTQYNLNKQLVNRRNEPYVFTPYYIVYINSKTYVVGKTDGHDNLSHYRLDRIKNIKLTNLSYLKHVDCDPYQYAKSKIYMYQGEDNNICIGCKLSILDNVIDIFGKDITLIQDGPDHFKAYVKSSLQGMTYLALQFIDSMEVLEPQFLRETIKEKLTDGLTKYCND